MKVVTPQAFREDKRKLFIIRHHLVVLMCSNIYILLFWSFLTMHRVSKNSVPCVNENIHIHLHMGHFFGHPAVKCVHWVLAQFSIQIE